MIELKDVVVIYPGPIGQPEKNLVALHGISITIKKGEIIAIVGESGSGKTTLINVMSGLLEPSAGLVFIEKKSLYNMPTDARDRFKATRLHVIHQDMTENLFHELTVEENVLLELAMEDKHDLNALHEVLEQFGLTPLAKLPVYSLSGGEKQLVCLAIAFLRDAPILLLDEPTSALDSKTKHDIMRTIVKSCRELGKTVIYTTHDPEIAAHADKVIGIFKGKFDRMLTSQLSPFTQEQVVDLIQGKYIQVPIQNGTIHLPQEAMKKLQFKDSAWLLIEEDRMIIFPHPPTPDR